jgi:hypothetical protein
MAVIEDDDVFQEEMLVLSKARLTAMRMLSAGCAEAVVVRQSESTAAC